MGKNAYKQLLFIKKREIIYILYYGYIMYFAIFLRQKDETKNWKKNGCVLGVGGNNSDRIGSQNSQNIPTLQM